MSSSVLTDKALRYMEQNTLNFIETKRIIESTNLMEFYKFGVEYDDIVANFSVPTGNRTESISGKLITVPSNQYLFQFPAKLKLYDANEAYNRVEPEVQTLYQRGLLKRRSLSVFINGIKVPDRDVYVYASQSGTDIFIPQKFFSKVSPNDIICVTRDYSDKGYNNFFKSDCHGNHVREIPTSITNLSKTQTNVWVNGFYVSKSDYDIDVGAKSFNVNFKEDYIVNDSYDIEVMCNQHQVGKYSEHYLSNDGKLFLYVPKNDPVLTETSIFVNMCDIYINGLRVSPSHLSQKSHRHIQYIGDINYDDNVTTEITVTDNHVEAKAFAEYLNDFMEYEKWASENDVLKSLADDETETDPKIDPKFISFSTLQFPPPNEYLFDRTETHEMSNEQRAELMIRENPHYIKNLLTFYGVEEENYNVQRNGIVKEGEKVTILLDTDSQDEHDRSTRLLEVFVNDKKIPDNKLVYHSQWDSDNIQIPISEFSLGRDKVDTVRLYNYPTKNLPIPYYRFSTGTTLKGHKVKISDVTGVIGDLGDYNLDELRVFKQILDKEHDTTHYFVDIPGGSIYYDFVSPETANYTLTKEYNSVTGKDELYIEIPYGSSINNNDVVIIVNPKFHESVMYNLSQTGDYNSQFRIVLNHVYNGEVIPFVTGKYLIKVFLNGKILVPELDYTYMTPEDYSSLTSSQIIFRRTVTLEDTIEVEISGVENKFYAAYGEIPPNKNHYGFVFFDKLDIPFSMDYFDLYVNDEKLTEDDVTVYTDRLVRIKKPLPFKNVVLVSRLSRDISDFKPYIDAFNVERCDFDSYIRQFCRDVLYDDTTDTPRSNELDQLFEEIFGEPENGVDPNYTPQQRFDTFLDRITRDYNRDQNLINKIFDANKRKSVEVAEYAILVPNTIRETHRVEFDANSPNDISEDFMFDPNIHYRTDLEIIALVYNVFKNHNIIMDSNNTLAQYADPLLYKYLYPNEVNEFDSNIEYDDMDHDVVLDSNENLNEDE